MNVDALNTFSVVALQAAVTSRDSSRVRRGTPSTATPSPDGLNLRDAQLALPELPRPAVSPWPTFQSLLQIPRS